MKIKADKGKRISIKSDTYDDLLYDTKRVMSVYYTKDGEQEYECLVWINGEYMYYTIRKVLPYVSCNIAKLAMTQILRAVLNVMMIF